MEKAKPTSKRPRGNEDSLPPNSPSLKRHMGAQPRSTKVSTTSSKKASAGQRSVRTPPKGLATPPQEPEIIDLCIDVVPKPVGPPTGGFPRYKDGDVIIDLAILGNLTYRLHSSTLSRVSPWFKDTLGQLVHEPDDRLAANFTRRTGICARYELSYNEDLDILVLARTTMTMVKVPKETLACPETATTATSITRSPISEVAAENLAASCQQQSPNTSPNIQETTEQPNHFLEAAQPQSAKAAQVDNVAASGTPEGGHTGVHDEGGNSFAVPGQCTIKIEERHIKQEQEEGPDPGISIKQENPELCQEDVMPTKESRVAPNGISMTTTENQATSRTTAAIEENHGTYDDRDDARIIATNVNNQDKQVTPPTAELMAAYKGLFRTYCGQTPAIDNKKINVALRQAEAIIKVAQLYGSVPTVRPYLGNCLLQFGRDISQTILQDPPRWLLLSRYLESALIFKEAAVHIIGNLGYWPWPTVQLKDMPDDLGTLLKSKIEKLKRVIGDVERTLFMTSINVEGEETLVAPTDKRTINTWYVTQLWKQWFIRAVAHDEAPKPTGRADGTKYRAIAKGVDAYLPLETVTEHIKAFREPSRLTRWDKQTIEEDLKMFKIFAQKQVQELCVNNSMLSVAEAGIEHLTCATIDDIDISWLQQGGSRTED